MFYPEKFDRLRVFLKSRKIVLVGEVIQDPIQGQAITASVLELNAVSESDPIEFLIDSNGGAGDTARIISCAIEFSKAPVYGIVIGNAFSAAFTILQACHARIACPKARLMFHGGLFIRIPTDALLNDVEIISEEEGIVKLSEKSFAWMAERISEAKEEKKQIALKSYSCLRQDLKKKRWPTFGKWQKQALEWWDREKYFTTQEALDYGFIDKIA